MIEPQTYEKLLSLSRKSEAVMPLALGCTLCRSMDFADAWYFVKRNGRIEYSHFGRNSTMFIVWPKTLPEGAFNPLPIGYLRKKAAIWNSFMAYLDEAYLRVSYIVRL